MFCTILSPVFCAYFRLLNFFFFKDKCYNVRNYSAEHGRLLNLFKTIQSLLNCYLTIFRKDLPDMTDILQKIKQLRLIPICIFAFHFQRTFRINIKI